jgi:heptosyltransferase III
MNEPSQTIERSEIYRILVCRPNHRLGNLLLLTPLVAELEALFPGAEVDIVSEGPLAADVFGHFACVRHVYCLPRRGFKHPVSFLSMIFKIRKTNYDLVIDPCLGSTFSRVLTRLFRGARKLGFDWAGRVKGLTHAAPSIRAPQHMAKRPIMLARWFASPKAGHSHESPVLDIRLSSSEHDTAKLTLKGLLSGSYPVSKPHTIAVFADATGGKAYSFQWWEVFLTTLLERASDCAFVEIVPVHGRSMLGSKWPGYYSTSVRRIGAVMAATDLVISADCGIMHLATASRVPTMGLFSITDAAVYGPYGADNDAITTQQLSPVETAQKVADRFPKLFTPCDAVTSSLFDQSEIDAPVHDDHGTSRLSPC